MDSNLLKASRMAGIGLSKKTISWRHGKFPERRAVRGG